MNDQKTDNQEEEKIVADQGAGLLWTFIVKEVIGNPFSWFIVVVFRILFVYFSPYVYNHPILWVILYSLIVLLIIYSGFRSAKQHERKFPILIIAFLANAILLLLYYWLLELQSSKFIVRYFMLLGPLIIMIITSVVKLWTSRRDLSGDRPENQIKTKNRLGYGMMLNFAITLPVFFYQPTFLVIIAPAGVGIAFMGRFSHLAYWLGLNFASSVIIARFCKKKWAWLWIFLFPIFFMIIYFILYNLPQTLLHYSYK